MKVVTADQHQIDPSLISKAAGDIVKKLRKAGFDAYIVGGAIRDLMLGGHPKDFDVATDATPEQVRNIFKGSRIIGRRFQIVHVRAGREIIEVTTFRGHHDSPEETTAQQSKQSSKGLLLRDNVYGSLEDDAARRDLTVNAMYYDPVAHTVLDQMNGVADIHARLIRIIGDPKTRYREDPVRMLRVLRFSAKLQFDLESDTEYALDDCGALLSEIPAARLFDEFLKLFLAGYARSTFGLLDQHGLFQYLFPEPAHALSKSDEARKLVLSAMESTDRRIAADKPVTPAFLLAAILWPVVEHRYKMLTKAGEHPVPAMHSAGQQITAEACLHIAIPKRFSIPMREMWEFQPKLERMQPKKLKDILASRRFRAAYDLLLLRRDAGAELSEACDFWTEQQVTHADIVGTAPSKAEHEAPKRRPRRRRRP